MYPRDRFPLASAAGKFDNLWSTNPEELELKQTAGKDTGNYENSRMADCPACRIRYRRECGCPGDYDLDFSGTRRLRLLRRQASAGCLLLQFSLSWCLRDNAVLQLPGHARELFSA